jgi:hypothetical protein
MIYRRYLSLELDLSFSSLSHWPRKKIKNNFPRRITQFIIGLRYFPSAAQRISAQRINIYNGGQKNEHAINDLGWRGVGRGGVSEGGGTDGWEREKR